MSSLAEQNFIASESTVQPPLDAGLVCLDKVPLPAIAAALDGGYFIIAKAEAGKALIQDPREQAPRILTEEELTARWSGQLVMVASRASVLGDLADFDITWFIPALVKYERSVVKRLLVHDGMQVKKGQLLIELDASELGADQEKVHSSHQDSLLAAARAHSLLNAVQTNAATPALICSATNPNSSTSPDFNPLSPRERAGVRGTATPSVAQSGAKVRGTATSKCLPGISPALAQEANRYLLSEYQAFRSELLSRDAEALHLQAGKDTAQETLNKLLALYPLHEERAADLKRLLEKNYIPKHQYLDEENTRVETAKEIDVQRKRLLETDTLIAQQREQRNAIVANFVRQTREQLTQAEQQLAQLNQDGVKLESRSDLLQLRAPVDGTVQQLAVHTEGGVVTEAQALMVVVPANEKLEIDAMVENKDIGFINQGQQVEVKVESFPFTRYGILDGKVMNVSLDAIADEKRGLLYQTRVLLNQTWISVEGKHVPLVPGMAVTVEIKTGKRRVIDYFLSQVLQYGNESVRER